MGKLYGKKMRSRRLIYGITQIGLARAMDVSVVTIWRWESGLVGKIRPETRKLWEETLRRLR